MNFNFQLFCLLIVDVNVKNLDKKGNYAVKVQGVVISPNPVVSGQPATFNITASTGKL